MGLLDRVRRRQRGAGRPGVPQRDSAAGGTRGGGPRARGLHVVRRGHRVRDRPVAVRGVRACGRVDRERLAPTATDANRARRMGAPDLRRLLDHRRRAAHTAHGLDPGRRAGDGRATGRRTLGECALRSRGAQATGRAAAHRARDGGPGRNGAGARDQLFPHVRRPARHPWRRDREHRGGGGGGGRLALGITYSPLTGGRPDPPGGGIGSTGGAGGAGGAGDAAGAVLTTIVLGIALAQLAAPTLMQLASRAVAAPLTPATVSPELTTMLRRTDRE